MLAANRLGKNLVANQLISEMQLQECVARAKHEKKRFIDVLLDENAIEEDVLISFLSKLYKIPIVDLNAFEMSDRAKSIVNPKHCIENRILPIVLKRDTLVLAVCDPTQLEIIDEIRFTTQKKIELVLGKPSQLLTLVEKYFSLDFAKLNEQMESDAEHLDEGYEDLDGEDDVTDEDAPIINFVTSLLVDAVNKRASDVHVEPYENDLRIRFRIDGTLISPVKPPVRIRKALISRLKVMAKLRLDEKRLPQDGRIRIRIPSGKVIDFRVNTLPTIYGEKVVLRILDKSNAQVDLANLGFEKDELEKLKKAVSAPWGMVLVTGATGSGKTTTLYSALNWINRENINISTIEDPVEYSIKGINQVHVKDKIGLSFANTLRALLRQDPDVILLGEMRDNETAQVGMKAALTGHMVLSTLHTNDASSTINRLLDMDIEPFLINSTLLMVVAQRLVRKICRHCIDDDARYDSNQLLRMGFPKNSIGKFKPKKGKGCSQCSGTGYHGRIAVHEALMMSENIKKAVSDGKTTSEIREIALKDGMRTLKTNTIRKVIRGLTTVDELQFVGSAEIASEIEDS